MTHAEDRPAGSLSRRLLGMLGASAATAMAAGAVTLPGASAAAVGSLQLPPAGRFGRLFQLPAFAEPSPAVIAALEEMGKPGGLLDAKDELAKGPKALITDASLSRDNPDNPTHTAGTTFMGQFMDHDVTFDASSRLGIPTAPETITNARTPAFDLDSLYGAGPFASPQLYASDLVKLNVESSGLFEDVPRTDSGQAIISDPRNDQTLIVSGLLTAFALFHNRAVDEVRAQGKLAAPADIFAAARQLTTWHYHWLIVHEFLPLFIGQDLVDEIFRRGRRFFTVTFGQSYIPVKFSGAAYRFGHSITRPSYRANLAGDNGKPFFALLFDPGENGKPDSADLRGGVRAPRRYIDWGTFFDFGDGQVKPNKRIDTKLSTPLFQLPLGVVPTHDNPISLPQRTLLRQLTWSLPSGQAIAQALGVPFLNASDFDELQPFGVGFEQNTPLWYYVLKEAELIEGGLHLGPVGGMIVGEVIIGLLRADPNSWVASAPDWRPTLPSRAGGGDFRMVDFLTFAGVDPASRARASTTHPTFRLVG